jgi:hypothetical protein
LEANSKAFWKAIQLIFQDQDSTALRRKIKTMPFRNNNIIYDIRMGARYKQTDQAIKDGVPGPG